MSTLLQDMMGLLKRNKKTTPKNNDYIAIARFSKPQDRLKPNPKVIERLVKLDDLKSYVNAANTGTQRLIVGGYSGDNGPGQYTEYVNTLKDAEGNPITADFSGSTGLQLVITLSDNLINWDNTLILVEWEPGFSQGDPYQTISANNGIILVNWTGNVDANYKVVIEQI